MDKEIVRSLLALGFGICFGASFFLLSYYRQNQALANLDSAKALKDSEEVEEPKESCCSTNESSCCQTAKRKRFFRFY
jgi:hypothetical protein